MQIPVLFSSVRLSALPLSTYKTSNLMFLVLELGLGGQGISTCPTNFALQYFTTLRTLQRYAPYLSLLQDALYFLCFLLPPGVVFPSMETMNFY